MRCIKTTHSPVCVGLLYLSDGLGCFPDTPADYPTVFLIPVEVRSCLPRLIKDSVDGKTCSMTEYTMSEIIA